MNLRMGQTVLVQGGVSHMAAQIALAYGARVVATASKAKQDIIESYGAAFSDYTTQSVDACVTEFTDAQGFDVIFNTNGGKQLE